MLLLQSNKIWMVKYDRRADKRRESLTFWWGIGLCVRWISGLRCVRLISIVGGGDGGFGLLLHVVTRWAGHILGRLIAGHFGRRLRSSIVWLSGGRVCCVALRLLVVRLGCVIRRSAIAIVVRHSWRGCCCTCACAKCRAKIRTNAMYILLYCT